MLRSCAAFNKLRMTDAWDVVVIGAGIHGTCAAAHVARTGLRTLQLEQFSFGHAKGSSHGGSRINRIVHTRPEFYNIIHSSYEQIAELEKMHGETLMDRCGMLWLGSPAYIKSIAESLRTAGFSDFEELTHQQISTRWPQLRFDWSWAGIVDPAGGMIYADKWLETFHKEFVSAGGTLYDECEVLSIDLSDAADDVIRLQTTTRGTISTRKAIVAAGSWVNKLLPELPVKSTNLGLTIAYWKTRNAEDTHLIESASLPTLIIHDGDKHLEAMPVRDHPGLLKFLDEGGDVFEAGEELERHSEKFITSPAKYLAEHFPAVDSTAPAKVAYCKYTMSPDSLYVVDFLDDDKRLALVGFLSGTGFKVAPGIGKALAQMISGSPIEFDLSLFKLARFKK